MLTIYLWSQFYDSEAVLTVMAVTVKFIGALRHAVGTEEFTVNCPEGFSVGELISELTTESPELKRSLINPQLEDPRPNVLILVNSREISALTGLETKLKDGDEVVLVPVVHGG